LEKTSRKKILPNVYTPFKKITKERSELTAFLEEKSIEEEEQPHANKNR
jgi:hypothetical protein